MKNKLKKLVTLLCFYALSFIGTVTAYAEETEAEDNDSTRISVELNEPIGDTVIIEADTAMGFITNYIRLMYSYGAATVGIICVLVIAISGMQYAMDSNSAEEAKKRIINSLSGLGLLFVSALILWFINPNFFVAG